MQEKDGWDKSKILATWLGTAAIPAVALIVGLGINSTLRDREIRAEYVKLAVQVLQNPDTAARVTKLRRWAVEVLGDMGPIPIPLELREALIGGEVVLPVVVYRSTEDILRSMPVFEATYGDSAFVHSGTLWLGWPPGYEPRGAQRDSI